MDVTLIRARGHAHVYIYKHMGKLQSAITSILRCESKFFQVKFLGLIHCACRYKNYVLKCSQKLHELFFFYLVCNLHGRTFDLDFSQTTGSKVKRGAFNPLLTALKRIHAAFPHCIGLC